MTKIEKALFVLLATIAVSYVGLRAYLNPLVNDEAYTFLYFIYTDRFIPFDTIFWSANNHPVNSLLTWVCYKLIGLEEWALRLPNVLAFILFTLYSFKIGTLLRSTWIRWSFWVSLLATPYLLELFGYTRGYGLSIAFFTAAIWHFIKAVERKKLLLDWQTWLFMIFALFSNLNLVNSYFIWILLFAFFSFGTTSWLKWTLHIFIRASILIIPILMGLQLKFYDQLYFGFQTNILDSFHSLLAALYGDISPVWCFFIIAVTILTAIGIVISKISSPQSKNTYFIIGIFLTLNILASLVQFWFLDVNLPRERTTIHWYFLLIASLFFSLDFIQTYWKKAFFLCIPLLLIPLGQIHRYNLFRASLDDWALQQFSDDFYNDLVKLQKDNNQLLTFESNVLFNKHVYDYLNMKNGTQLNDLQYAWNITNTSADIVLISDSLGQFPAKDYKIISSDKQNSTSLLKRKSPKILTPVYNYQIPHPDKIENQRYEFGDIGLDTLKNKNLLFSFSMDIRASSAPHLLYTTIELKDSIGEIIATEQIEITPLRHDWTNASNTKFTFTWYNIPASANLAHVYIWNYRVPKISVEAAECTIFKLD
ncbi:ArnT family glycosyltransferase [Owenweeksia hongkongensis]|uniref:ArnT family glycosyltransferase n=1 Tax=Owenweeksia hongkongensis TaxID=253245 RepID=UPI003A9363A3